MDDYYGEEDEEMGVDYGEEKESARGPLRQFSPEQEREILESLLEAGSQNREFAKVMNILQQDIELRPLIFEHEILLRCLATIHELKAEFMLSILTAAETEMYEN